MMKHLGPVHQRPRPPGTASFRCDPPAAPPPSFPRTALSSLAGSRAGCSTRTAAGEHRGPKTGRYPPVLPHWASHLTSHFQQ
eukprot:1156138-Pelagomonas_calceolata.AAC.13